MKYPQKYAKSVETQAKQVFDFMLMNGSINRYEAERFGVCHLAARVQNLEEKGFVYRYVDENGISDYHGIKHNKIRRYFIDWLSMKPEAKEYFARWAL